jgi:CheY-like chemotaxis protein
MKFNPLKNHRILVIDDNPAIHDDYRKILGRTFTPDPVGNPGWPIFELSFAYQGQEGLDLIRKSLREKRPFALAFVDVRMPPGWDGIETVCRLWKEYPELQVVICTAYADFSWEEMVSDLTHLDRMIVLKKPFECIEVLQLAVAMTEKWRLNQMIKLRVVNLEKLIESYSRAENCP